MPATLESPATRSASLSYAPGRPRMLPSVVTAAARSGGGTNLAARIMATGLDFASALTLGLFPNKMLTRDQVTSLGADNVVAAEAKGFADLGIEPADMDSVLPEYLWCFRPSGQYAAIKESAKNLKKV